MKTGIFIRTALTLYTFTANGIANAALIDFDSIPLTGPSTYAAAGPTRDLTIASGDPNIPDVVITGGTILTQETFMPANSTSLYGTAFFGGTFPPAQPYSNTVVLTFSAPITNFFLDVYNGQVFNVTYTVADNSGHSSSFLLAPNLNSGTSQIGFAAAGSVITITSDAGNAWDFSIDNIGFNQALPTTIPTTVTPITSITTPDPQIVLVAENQNPPLPTLTLDQRLADGLDNQKRRGRNGESNRVKVQGFDDSALTTVPVPSSVILFGSAISGLLALKRKKTRIS